MKYDKSVITAKRANKARIGMAGNPIPGRDADRCPGYFNALSIRISGFLLIRIGRALFQGGVIMVGQAFEEMDGIAGYRCDCDSCRGKVWLRGHISDAAFEEHMEENINEVTILYPSELEEVRCP